jgi:deoxyribodipyrimidine photo-lyase
MRRTFRIADNAPLWNAVAFAAEVIPFVVLSESPSYRISSHRRLFIRGAVRSLAADLAARGSNLAVLHGAAPEAIAAFVRRNGIEAVYASRVFDRKSLERDALIASALTSVGCRFFTVNSSTLFDPGEIRTAAGEPYRVFTPFSNAVLSRANEIEPPFPPPKLIRTPEFHGAKDIMEATGFALYNPQAGEHQALDRLESFVASGIESYATDRDIPSNDGTSGLSPYLANGCIGIRTVYFRALKAREIASPPVIRNINVFLKELLWREFYYHVLAAFPYVIERSFKPQFERLAWSTNQAHFSAWREGRTGFPIVDAGMRQLKREGWMHNRVRMIAASFLVKDLHIDWRKGESFFFDNLIDADIASNNGGWQWTAGTGTDAAPYFRVFNPIAQSERFDPHGAYIRKYIHELSFVPDACIHQPSRLNNVDSYPRPIVDHRREREVTLQLYGRNMMRQSASA